MLSEPGIDGGEFLGKRQVPEGALEAVVSREPAQSASDERTSDNWIVVGVEPPTSLFYR